MGEIIKSIGCVYCGSDDISKEVKYTEKETIKEDNSIYQYSRKKVILCHCNKCNKDYSVYYGTEKYTVFKEGESLTCANDGKLLAIYTSESGRNYRIISLFSKGINSEIYMILSDKDRYPIILSEEEKTELIKEPEKVKTLMYDTFMNRYR